LKISRILVSPSTHINLTILLFLIDQPNLISSTTSTNQHKASSACFNHILELIYSFKTTYIHHSTCPPFFKLLDDPSKTTQIFTNYPKKKREGTKGIFGEIMGQNQTKYSQISKEKKERCKKV
jgi:hypothetical protein